MGKGFDASMAVGPWVLPLVEVGSAYPLKMQLKVGGNLWQQGTSDDYLFRIPQIIEHLTQGVTLEPGDLISLGTLGGMPGYEFGSAARKLAPGVQIEGEIEKIGRLVVPVKIETAPVTPPPPAA
jgi:2-keto-4-pentenoate hydratase/2-oxohepta-3-ene-1,7-dioic acid hydratase in catechol pathway